jgi:hypothetical protein
VPITFDFSGTIFRTANRIIDPFAYTGRYTFESEQDDIRPDDPRLGIYRNTSIEVTFGNTRLVAGGGDLRVRNDTVIFSSPIDTYSVSGSAAGASRLSFSLLYDSTEVFFNDLLPLTPPPVTGLEPNIVPPFAIQGFGFEDGLLGTVDSLTCSLNCGGGGGGDPKPVPVPVSEPSTLAGMAMMLPLLALISGRKRRRR